MMMTMSSVAQQQEQQVGTISKQPASDADGLSQRAPAAKQLSVVLPGAGCQAPGNQRSLVTPTIVTTASSPTHLFGSLAVQLSGQEVGLFTGLPSCTPTSADGLAAAAANLTHINPFFWGVGQQAAAGPNQEQQHQQQEQQASEKAKGRKLQLDQKQQGAMLLSPLSFLLSPEQEAWLRLQHPLAPTEQHQHQHQEGHQQHRNPTAQDLTSHQQAAARAHNPPISSSSPRCSLQPPEGVQLATAPPVAHHQGHFSQQILSGKGADFSHQQAPNLSPTSQPTPMIATLHYDGLHYDPHLQQLYLAQQQQQPPPPQQDMYHHHHHHHQAYTQMVTSAPKPSASTSTYQTQAYAPAQDAPLAETLRPEQREPPVIVADASSSSPHHQFNVTSASNSSVRSSVSRDTTVNVEVLAQSNGSSTERASQQRATTSASEASGHSTEVVVKKKSKGGRKKKQVTHEELMARKNRSKERNRVAAKRCRQKRKQFLDELRDRIDSLSDSNKRVLKENTMLKSELELLRKHHKTCRIISQ